MESLRITQVEKQKKKAHRYNIFINGDFAFSVHEDLLVKYRLLKGEAIDAEDMARIALEDERHSAYLAAIRFLSVRPRSSKEVRIKLKQSEYEPDLIEATVNRLTEERYLDDAQFARIMADNRIRLQKKGRLWVKQELRQKGVSAELISESIGAIDMEEEEQQAYSLAEKRWKQMTGDITAQKRKLLSYMLRRGYTSETVLRILKQLNVENTDMEIFLDESE